MTKNKTVTNYGVVIHRDFKPLYVDEKYAQISGYRTPEEVMQLKSLFDIISPNFHSEALNNYQEIMSGDGLPVVRNFLNDSTDGHSFSVIAIDQRIDWEGAPALQVTIIDISEIDQAHKKLLAQEQKYKDLFWNSTQGFIIHRDFKILMANPAYVNMIGASSIAEVMALDSIEQLIPDQHLEFAHKQYQKLINHEEVDSNIIINNYDLFGNLKFFHIFESVIDWDGEPAVQLSLIDVTEKFHNEKNLRYQANHDDLTDVFNRRAIIQRVNDSLPEATSMSCILIDLDDFKAINDNYGHSVGDSVLKRFSQLCKRLCNREDILGRWGGEEFIIIQRNRTKNDALTLAEQIRRACIESVNCSENDAIKITVSIGVCHCNENNINFDDLVYNADDAMYQAKYLGKNQVVLY